MCSSDLRIKWILQVERMKLVSFQWAIELSEFDIRYQPRSAIKAQTLADFIAKFTPNYGDLDEVDEAKKWVVYADDSSTQYAGGIEVILKSP